MAYWAPQWIGPLIPPWRWYPKPILAPPGCFHPYLFPLWPFRGHLMAPHPVALRPGIWPCEIQSGINLDGHGRHIYHRCHVPSMHPRLNRFTYVCDNCNTSILHRGLQCELCGKMICPRCFYWIPRHKKDVLRQDH